LRIIKTLLIFKNCYTPLCYFPVFPLYFGADCAGFSCVLLIAQTWFVPSLRLKKMFNFFIAQTWFPQTSRRLFEATRKSLIFSGLKTSFEV